MSSNKLLYDECETNLRLSYNRNMLDRGCYMIKNMKMINVVITN